MYQFIQKTFLGEKNKLWNIQYNIHVNSKHDQTLFMDTFMHRKSIKTE